MSTKRRDLETHKDMKVRWLPEDEGKNWNGAALVEEHEGLLTITISQEEARTYSSL